ncbi:MAG: bacterial Ig-like domain-containing protein [Candidatus Enteromonas sp.]
MKNDVRKLAFVFAAAALLAGGALAHVSSAEVLEVGAAAPEKTVTYTVSSKDSVTASGDVPTDSAATYSQTYSTVSQMTSGNSATLTLSGLGGIDISSITLSMKSNSSKGAGTLTYSANGGSSTQLASGAFNTSAWYGAWSTSPVDVEKDLVLQDVNDLQVKISATANSLYIYSYKITYTDEVVASAPLTKIEIGGNATKKTYFVGDVFDPSGLTVTGYFEDGTNQDVTGAAEWSYDPATLSLGNTTLTATASVTVGEVTKTASELIEGLTVEESKAITYSKLTKVADLKAGSQVVFANSDGSKLMGFHKGKNNIEAVDCGTRLKDSNVVVEPTVDTDVGVYIAEKGSVDGTFAFKDSKAKQYLYAAGGSDNNYLKLQENIDGNASFEVTLTGANPEVVAKGSATRNNLKYNSTSNLFACYASGQQAISMYVYNPAFSENGGVIVDMLLNELACDNGVTAPDQETWNTIGEFFVDLSDSDKAIMKNAKADVAGTDLEQAMAKYDYIVAKYTAYNDFIGREPGPAQANNVFSNMAKNDQTMIALIGVLSLGVAAAGAYFFAKKRKAAR